MAPTYDRHKVLRNEQPINWSRAFIVGFIGVSMMMAFVDAFNMMGWTPFTFEKYVGSVFYGAPYNPRGWVLGLVVNWFVGGLFGILYGYLFEYVFMRAKVPVGILSGLIHAAFAAIVVFPFFNMAHEQLATGMFERFGFLGSALGAPTFLILLAAHLVFGATMGLLYGPVRAERARMRDFEPGEYGLPGERGVISDLEDPFDRLTSWDDPEDRLSSGRHRRAG